MNAKLERNNRLMKQAGMASVAVAFTLIIMKAITFCITGSVAILSSLFDSTQDLITSGVNMVAIHHATEPADKEHRFGHGKAQGIGSLIQAVIIAIASVFLMVESVRRFCQPEPLKQVSLGLGITVVAIILTFFLIRFQTRVIGETKSLSIAADRAHYTGDIVMNIGVIVSLICSYYLKWEWVDSVFGVGVSLYLFIVVYQILRESCNMLMDKEMPEDFRNSIHAIVHAFPEVTLVHDLKTRQSGSHAFVQFSVHLDDTLTLRQAHDITDKIEDRIKEQFPDTEVIIHPEPERKKT